MFKWAMAISVVVVVILTVIAADMGALPALLNSVYKIPYGDKAGHFLLMGILSLAVNAALYPRSMQVAGRRVLTGTLVLLVLVTLEEFSQIFFSRRSFDLVDLAFSYLGILGADWLVRWKKQRK